MMILNQANAATLFQGQTESNRPDAAVLAGSLRQAMQQLKGDFFTSAGVDYRAMKASEAYADYQKLSAQLQQVDLQTLPDEAHKLAFWINLYNVLVMDGILALNVQRSVKDVPRFFQRVAYQIGSEVFSLDTIEHGLLRRNRKIYWFQRHPLASGDPRQRWMLASVDPRIHFALVCGAKSCPPIGVYQAEQIEDQLELAASGFVNSENVQLQPEQKRVLLSKIFDWYGADFGTRPQLLQWIANRLRDPQQQDWLKQNAQKVRIDWQPYDWQLNQAA
ncbi:MAG: DUF547 domain-containing protein [Candidatus Sericytochromatia bacterium]|nr:DUF547 domain-containing protein [Candidatus Sericytochromatia bacterium]